MTAPAMLTARGLHSMGLPWSASLTLARAGLTTSDAAWLDNVFARRRGRKRAAKRERTRERQRARQGVIR
jgi:hypothetical protein